MSETASNHSKARYYVETLGCQMNVYDGALAGGLLEENGWVQTHDPAQASAILLNTCSVREKAEETAIERLRNLAHHTRRRGAVLGVLGCMAENRGAAIRELVPEVRVVLGPDHYRELPGMLACRPDPETYAEIRGPVASESYQGVFPVHERGPSAYVAIQRGCDKACSYCIVPGTRGPERSRMLDDVIEEVRRLADRGVREVTLLGQTVNSWHDGQHGFAQLLTAVHGVPGIARIRMMSPHPRYFTEPLVEVMAALPGVCPHVHLPLQSGSSVVLRAMRRSYTRDRYKAIVERLRRHLPEVSLTTDLIAGFPGESESDHNQTLDLMREIRFDHAFMFAYSPRPGTPAARLPDDPPAPVRARRLQELIDLQLEHTRQRLDEWMGREVEILVEHPARRDPDKWVGRLPQFHKVIVQDSKAVPGDLLRVRVSDRVGQTLVGAQDARTPRK